MPVVRVFFGGRVRYFLRPVKVRPVGLPRVEGLPAWFSALVVATVYLPPVAAVLLPAGAVAVVDGVPAAWRLLAERMLRPVLGAGCRLAAGITTRRTASPQKIVLFDSRINSHAISGHNIGI